MVVKDDTTPPYTGKIDPIGDLGVRYHARARHIPGAGNMKRMIRIESLNVGSMISRNYDLEDLIQRRRLDIMCLQEVGWCNFGNSTRFLNCKTKDYKMFYHGVTNERNEVGIVLAAKCILSIKKDSVRLMHYQSSSTMLAKTC